MKKKKGFTLIELLVAVAIFSIAMIGISNAILFGTRTSVRNTKKVDTTVLAQHIIQTYKSQGKNYIKSSFSGNSYSGYCYFDSVEELNNVIEGSESLTAGTLQNMIDGKDGSKNFGAYIEFSTSNILGKKPGTTDDITLQSGFDNIRIYVMVVNLKEEINYDSSLVFYLGR